MGDGQGPGAEERRKIEHLQSLGKNKAIILESVKESPTFVHVCADAGIPINTQNKDGDTALHLAVRTGKIDVAEALLMAGADLSCRNLLGLAPLDEASGDMERILQGFKPGLVVAVSKGDASALQRLIRMWCHPRSIIKDGKSALQILQASSDDNRRGRCLELLRHKLRTLELVHSVLRDDEKAVQEILSTDTKWNINIQHRDRNGVCPLSCAIEHNNHNTVKTLLQTGKVSLDLRVRENRIEDVTEPLIFKALHKSCSPDIWNSLMEHCDPLLLREKDKDGNTALLRAIQEGKDDQFIERLIHHQSGTCLLDRTKDGKLAVELASELYRTDIVAVIHQYILNSVGQSFLMSLPVGFYGRGQLEIKNNEGKTLAEMTSSSGNHDDVQAIQNYSRVENYGLKLFTAAARGDVQSVKQLNKAPYKDKNGFTALTRAIVHNQQEVVEKLITSRPSLKIIPDNHNRYPLHYAYILPEETGRPLISLLLQKDPQESENKKDKEGRLPADYIELRGTDVASTMLQDILLAAPSTQT